jgi:ribokinase
LSTEKPIVVVGSINADLVAVAGRIPSIGETVIGTDFKIHPGGKGANQAVAVARLGYPVRMIGRLGSDHFGAELKAGMQSAGVECSGVQTSEGPSGVALILVSEQGENCIVVAPGANARVTPQDVESNLSSIRHAGMVLCQLEIPLETIEYLAEICRREHVPLILDPAPAQALPQAVFRDLAWFTPNETEAAFYAANGRGAGTSPMEISGSLQAKGARGVLLKRGSRGAYVAASGDPGESIAAFPVTAVDSTAAGDAFNGGFATALMRGKSPLESAVFASAVAAISVTRAGAQTSMPSMREVEQFLDDHLARE